MMFPDDVTIDEDRWKMKMEMETMGKDDGDSGGVAVLVDVERGKEERSSAGGPW